MKEGMSEYGVGAAALIALATAGCGAANPNIPQVSYDDGHEVVLSATAQGEAANQAALLHGALNEFAGRQSRALGLGVTTAQPFGFEDDKQNCTDLRVTKARSISVGPEQFIQAKCQGVGDVTVQTSCPNGVANWQVPNGDPADAEDPICAGITRFRVMTADTGATVFDGEVTRNEKGQVVVKFPEDKQDEKPADKKDDKKPAPKAPGSST